MILPQHTQGPTARLHYATRQRPRRLRIKELPPRRKWGGEVARRIDNHSITPLLRLGRVMGNLRTHSSSLLMPFRLAYGLPRCS